MKLSSSKNTIVILIALLALVILFAVYYYVVLPKKADAESLESSVSSLKSDIANIEDEIAKLEQLKSKGAENINILRQKVPEKRNINDLILNIEEIEYVTGSRILGIDFNNYDQSIAESVFGEDDENNESDGNATSENDENATSENTDSNAENNNEESKKEEDPVSSMAKLVLPSSLKLITLSIEVETPSYEKLVEFIRELEKLDRIIHVDAIEYDVPGEEQEFEANPKKSLDAKILITTFYYEGN